MHDGFSNLTLIGPSSGGLTSRLMCAWVGRDRWHAWERGVARDVTSPQGALPSV